MAVLSLRCRLSNVRNWHLADINPDAKCYWVTPLIDPEVAPLYERFSVPAYPPHGEPAGGGDMAAEGLAPKDAIKPPMARINII